jgi:hypothetical protein
MSITSQQLNTLKSVAEAFALGNKVTNYDVVIPWESQDLGWDFHPDYQELVNTVEIYTAEGCFVLVVTEDYEVINSDWHVFSFGDC